MTYSPKLHQRYYDKDGNLLPSVTTITGRHPDGKAAMLAAAVKLTQQGIDHKKLWAWKADIGTCCHDLIHRHIMELGTPDPDIWPKNVIKPAKIGLRAYKKWERAAKPVYLASEIKVINERHRYGGTLDIWADVGGVRRVIDIKTGGWWASAEMQIAAYDEAVMDEILGANQIDLMVSYQKVWEWGTPMGLQLDCGAGGYTVRYFMQSTMGLRWKQFLNLLGGYKLEKEGDCNARND